MLNNTLDSSWIVGGQFSYLGMLCLHPTSQLVILNFLYLIVQVPVQSLTLLLPLTPLSR